MASVNALQASLIWWKIRDRSRYALVTWVACAVYAHATECRILTSIPTQSRAVVAQFEQYIKLNKKIPPEVLVSVNQIDDASKLADTIASHIAVKIQEKQISSGNWKEIICLIGKSKYLLPYLKTGF